MHQTWSFTAQITAWLKTGQLAKRARTSLDLHQNNLTSCMSFFTNLQTIKYQLANWLQQKLSQICLNECSAHSASIFNDLLGRQQLLTKTIGNFSKFLSIRPSIESFALEFLLSECLYYSEYKYFVVLLSCRYLCNCLTYTHYELNTEVPMLIRSTIFEMFAWNLLHRVFGFTVNCFPLTVVWRLVLLFFRLKKQSVHQLHIWSPNVLLFLRIIISHEL